VVFIIGSRGGGGRIGLVTLALIEVEIYSSLLVLVELLANLYDYGTLSAILLISIDYRL
jgi:hypothetical protein